MVRPSDFRRSVLLAGLPVFIASCAVVGDAGATAEAAQHGGPVIASGQVAPAEREDAATMADAAIAALVSGDGVGQPLAGASLVVLHGEEVLYEGAAGCARFSVPTPEVGQVCETPMAPGTRARVASVSKVAVALAVARLAEAGDVSLDDDIADYLDWFPVGERAGVTLRRVLSHTAGIRDPEAYWVAAPGRIADVMSAPGALFPEAPDPDAAIFAYANVNYGLAAGVIEAATGERFDLAAGRLALAPLGIAGGFNWSGVPSAERIAAATVYRWDEDAGAWAAQVDGADDLGRDAPHFLADDVLDRERFLAGYSPGDNPTLFSPQGGLRASAEEIARLVAAASGVPAIATPVWRVAASDAGNRAPGNEWAKAFTAGLEVNESDVAVAPGRTLVGHSGEAYGLYSGAWRVLDVPLLGDVAPNVDAPPLVVAFLVTGVKGEPAPGNGAAFNAPAEAMMRIGLEVADRMTDRVADATSTEEPHPEARPFDRSRDAMFDVDAAFAAAAVDRRNVALVLGANWCHDSRGLAGRLELARFRTLVESGFHLVYVDVGRRDRNLDVARRFGVEKIEGTPTIIFAAPDGAVLNPDEIHEWRNAASRTEEETYRYFKSHASGGIADVDSRSR